MDRDRIISMDPNILVSMINMKLRDYYSSLDSFCDDIDIEKEIVINKLQKAGYEYIESQNQFK